MNLSIFLRSLFIGICFLCWNNATAQTGSWNPAGADLSYPRTLLKANQVDDVRNSLDNPVRFHIYESIFNYINTSLPDRNSLSGERRNCAKFAKNTAFVVLMNRKPLAGTLTTLSATEREQFISHVRTLLENINTAVENYSNYTEWQWRSKELIDYMVAYDLIRGAGVDPSTLGASRTRLQTFAGNLHKQSITPYFFLTFFGNIKNNHTLMTASALGLSAVVLNDVGGTDASMQPVNWINTGFYNLDNVLWRDASRQSNPTAIAGYAEGPYYFKYAFLNCLPFIRAMGNFLPDGNLTYTFNNTSRSIRNPYFDPAYDLLYEWITAIQMPDGRFPALEDSFIDMGMPELALTGKSRYVSPLALSKLGTELGKEQLNSLLAQLQGITVDMRAAFLAANLDFTTPQNKRLTSLPVSGNLVFRSGNDTLANYLHVYGKNGLAQSVTGGHNQGDASSFILHAKGQLLALDPGYLSSTRRGEVGEGVHHNLLLIDGAGPVMGTSGTTNDANAFIQNTFSTGQLSYGEVRTAYRSANIVRKTLFVRDAYYLMADYVSSSTSRTYTWQLHGYGLEGGTAVTGSFSDSLATQTGIWHKNGVNLKAHVTATGGASSYGKATNVHELTYSTTESHTTLQVHKSNVAQTQFLSLLYPYTTATASVKTISNAQTAALAAAEGGYKDLAFAQADSSTVTHTSLPLPVTSDALLTFFSLSPDGNFSQAFVEQGRSLLYGAVPVISSSKRANISWQKSSKTEFNGYTNRSTILSIYLEEAPVSVSGSSVSSYQYDAATKSLAITFSGPSDFKVTVLGEQSALPVTLISFKGKRQAKQVQLIWSTATETANAGFEIWRQAEGESNFKRVGFVKGTGSSSVTQNYFFADVSAPEATVYYRLKQLDQDGTFSYSPVIALHWVAVSMPSLSVSPVPADGSVILSFSDPAKDIHVRILNTNGKLLQQFVFRQQTELQTSHFEPGLYFIQTFDLAGQPISATKKLVIRH